MDLGLIFVIYTIGIILIVTEAMIPGWMIGLVGLVGVIAGVVMGFGHHWSVGVGQIQGRYLLGRRHTPTQLGRSQVLIHK